MKEKEIYKELIQVLEKYRQLIIDEKKQLGFVNDITLLPRDKDTLKVYLIAALMSCNTIDDKVFYMWAYEELATFQPNVGKKSPYSPAIVEILDKKYNDISKSKSEKTKNNILQEIHNISQKDMIIIMQYYETIAKERKKLLEELAKLDI